MRADTELQAHDWWSRVPGERAAPQLPQRDAGDSVQAILVANANVETG